MVNYVGDAGANVHAGTVFKDTLDGQGGNDTLSGADGNDSIIGGSGGDQLGGGLGKDTIFGGLDADVIDGGSDADTDQLFGEGGADIIYGKLKDSLDGGADTDSFILNLGVVPGVNIDLSSLTTGGSISFLGTTLTGFEAGFLFLSGNDDKAKAASMSVQIFGGGGADTLLGGGMNDQLNGGTELTNDADVVKGGDGGDSLVGGVGDLLDGGPGTDTFSLVLTNATSDFTVSFAPLYAGGTVFVGQGIRVVRFEYGSIQLGSGDDTVKTGSLAAQSGINVTAGDGNDTLVGGDGFDNLAGQGGNDVIKGGAGFDTANYQYEFAAVSIDLNIVGFQDTGGAGFDSLIGIEWVNGSGEGDRIVGNAENNKFEGYNGADTLIGGIGDDTLNGGAGGYDALTDTDRLSGGAGKDTYNGGVGDDVLVWSATFHTAVAAPDQILGLEAGDVIHVKDIDANTAVGGDQAFTIVTSLTGVAGQLAVSFNGSKTQFLMDTNGDAIADGMFEAAGDHTGHAEFVL